MSKFNYAIMNDAGECVAIGQLSEKPKKFEGIEERSGNHKLGRVRKKSGEWFEYIEKDVDGKKVKKLKRIAKKKTKKQLKLEAEARIEALEIVDE